MDLARMLAPLILAVVQRDFVPLSHENRIIGGFETSIHDVPWTVSLQVSGFHVCGGAIISAKWVLTAAHCTEDYGAHQLQIRAGSNSNTEGGTLYKVLKVIQHENYITHLLHNDISAIKTVSVIKFGPTVNKAALPEERTWPPVGAELRVSGWGRIEGKQRTSRLRMADVQRFPFDTCKDYFRDTDPESQLCAGSTEANICNGDTGGPLVWGDVLVGLVSYSDRACRAPGDGYTDVIVYRKWIKSHTDV